MKKTDKIDDEKLLTPRQRYIKRVKEQTLRDLGREINEENMAKITIDTGWEKM